MSETIISKTCRTCNQTKPITEFYKASVNRDGYNNQCKSCYSIKNVDYARTEKGKESRKRGFKKYRESENGKLYLKQYAKNHRGSIRGNARKYAQSEKGKAKHRQYIQRPEVKLVIKVAQNRYEQSDKGKVSHLKCAKRYNARHPERVAARQAVVKAIKDGRLLPPNSLQCHYGKHPAEHYHHHKGYAPEHWLDVVPVCIPCHTKIRLAS